MTSGRAPWNSTVNHFFFIVTWMARALLRNGPIYTPRPNTHTQQWNNENMQPVSMQRIGKHISIQAQWRRIPTVLRITWLVWSSLYNNRTVFSVREPCGGYITRITPAVQSVRERERQISPWPLHVVGGDEGGSLKSVTVKYGRESQGTRTQERLRWQELAAYKKDRPFSRQRGRPTKTRPYLSKSNKYLVMSPRRGSTLRLTDWLTNRQSQCDFYFEFSQFSVWDSHGKY
jgi:hypothetical protein